MSYEENVSPAYEDELTLDVGAVVLVPTGLPTPDLGGVQGLVIADCQDGTYLVDVGGLLTVRRAKRDLTVVVEADPWGI